MNVLWCFNVIIFVCIGYNQMSS
eukprot:COSAG01_NODE_75532_length_195_cov_27.500000_1_plen_22_part_10